MLKIAFSPIYAHPLPEKHRFPMQKYELLPEQLVYEGTAREENFFEPVPLSQNQILKAHTSDYWNKLQTLSLDRKEERRTGFPLSEQLIEREVLIAGASLQTTSYALEYGVSFNIAGGTHHAFTNRGEGFCLLNDIAIGAYHLLDTNEKINKVLVVDLDVHQGNGTAQIFEDEQRVFTFSMHGKKNYPYHKQTSDLDIALEDYTDDKTYLKLLKDTLPKLIEEQNPDFVFYQAGVDVLATDKLGRLGLSKAGCKQRDEFVFHTCKENNIAVAVSMGGGYSPKIADIVEAHANTYRLAQEIFF